MNLQADAEQELPPVTLAGRPVPGQGPGRRPLATATGAALALTLACLVSFVLVASVRAPHDEVSVGPSQPTAEASWDTVTPSPTARPSGASGTPTGRRATGPATGPATATGGAAPTASGTVGPPSRDKGSTATPDGPVRPTGGAGGTTGTGGSRSPSGALDAAVVFTDPAPEGDAYVPLPHCPVLKGTARVPAGQRMWFATRYTGETRYTLLGPADTLLAAPGGRVAWSKLVVLGGDGQFLKGAVIALFLPAEWADYLLSARGFDGRPVIDAARGDPTGFTTAVLPPHSTAAAALKVRRREGSPPCGG